jgi:hypothetical protein
MISTPRRIILLLALHVAFFIFFPNAGRYGLLYGWVSLALWCYVVHALQKPLDFLSGIFPGLFIFCDLIVLAGAFACIAMTMPQSDGMHPVKKLACKHYPSKTDINKGLAQFGLAVPATVENAKIPDIKMPDKADIEKAKKALEDIEKQ